MQFRRVPRFSLSALIGGPSVVDLVCELNQKERRTLTAAAKILAEIDERAQAIDPTWQDEADERTDIVLAELALNNLVEANGVAIGYEETEVIR